MYHGVLDESRGGAHIAQEAEISCIRIGYAGKE